MSGERRDFDLGRYRGYLVLLAHSLWDDKFRGKCDPSDLAQQALLEAHEQREKFCGATAAEFEGWLRAILAHTVADAVRALHRGKRDTRLEQSIEAELAGSSARHGWFLADDQSSPSERAAKAEELNRMADAIRRLPPDQQLAVTLHDLAGLTMAETADRIGKTVPAVAGLIRRGCKRVKELMTEGG